MSIFVIMVHLLVAQHLDHLNAGNVFNTAEKLGEYQSNPLISVPNIYIVFSID